MTPHDGELEERLRRHYQSSLGSAPDPELVWEQVAQRLEQQIITEAIEFADDRRGRRVKQTAQYIATPAYPGGATTHPTKRIGRWRTFAAIAATLLAIAMGGTVFGLLKAEHVRPIDTTDTTLAGKVDLVTGMQMLSDSNGWAIGIKAFATQNQAGVLLHFDGHRWSVAESLAHTNLYSISMISSGEGWIAGDFYTGQRVTRSFLLHYKGGRWVEESTPFEQILDVKMVSATFGWGSGDSSPNRSLVNGSQQIAVYHDGIWTMIGLPSSLTVSILHLWFTSLTDGWATDPYPLSPSGNGFWHYTNGHWSQTLLVSPTNAFIDAFEMTSSTNGWATGNTHNQGGGSKTLLLFHYNGVTWSHVVVPSNVLPEQRAGILQAFFVVSPTEFWIVGSSYIFKGPYVNGTNLQYFMLHYANGVWSAIQMPQTLHPVPDFVPNVISVPAPNDVWIYVGQDNGTVFGKPTIVHYHNGICTIYQ